MNNQQVIHRSFLPLFIGVLFAMAAASLPSSVFAFTSTAVGGSFNGSEITWSAALFDDVTLINGVATGFSSTTYPFISDTLSGLSPSRTAHNHCTVVNTNCSMSISNLTGEPSGTYYAFIGFRTPACTGWYEDCDDYYYMRVVWDGSTITDYDFEDTTTRIYDLSPKNFEVVSTSSPTTLTAFTYIATQDWSDDTFVRFKYKRNVEDQAAVSLVAAQGGLWHTIDFPETLLDHYDDVSTTTTFDATGQYTFVVEVRKSTFLSSVLSFLALDSLFDSGLVVSTSTQFVVVQRNAYDIFIASTTSAIDGFFSSTTLSFNDVKSACSFSTAFSITDCLGFLFGWQSVPMTTAFNNIKNNFFTYAPFGYVTRAVQILGSTSTSTLPTLSYTFASSSPAFLSNAEFTFNPWQWFYVDGSPVKDQLVANDGSDKNIWEIFEPLINIIVALSLILLVVKDLTNIHGNNKNL